MNFAFRRDCHTISFFHSGWDWKRNKNVDQHAVGVQGKCVGMLPSCCCDKPSGPRQLIKEAMDLQLRKVSFHDDGVKPGHRQLEQQPRAPVSNPSRREGTHWEWQESLETLEPTPSITPPPRPPPLTSYCSCSTKGGPRTQTHGGHSHSNHYRDLRAEFH